MLPEDQHIMLLFVAAVLVLDVVAIMLYRGARP